MKRVKKTQPVEQVEPVSEQPEVTVPNEQPEVIMPKYMLEVIVEDCHRVSDTAGQPYLNIISLPKRSLREAEEDMSWIMRNGLQLSNPEFGIVKMRYPKETVRHLTIYDVEVLNKTAAEQSAKQAEAMQAAASQAEAQAEQVPLHEETEENG